MSVAFTPTPEQLEQLHTQLNELKSEKGALVMALQKAQEIFKYLPRQVLEIISKELNISVSEIYGVATFYSQFRLTPIGKYRISVCMGTACYVKGANDILEKIKSLLKIDTNQTTPDGLFTIEASRCIGCCGLAPVMTVNDEVYGKLTVGQVEGILKKYNE